MFIDLCNRFFLYRHMSFSILLYDLSSSFEEDNDEEEGEEEDSNPNALELNFIESSSSIF